ncbi:MAG: tRNA lysidine(34) synthetase TilS [bacterium]
MDLFASFKNKILPYFSKENSPRLVLAVSGGIDSVVLLDLMTRLHTSFPFYNVVAHLNHNLRGKASEGDFAFVRQEAKKRGLPFEGKKLPAGKLKKAGNLQEEARKLRYAFLAEVALKHRADFMVTAHQADDQAETFFMRLIRGSGSEGLKGMEVLTSFDPREWGVARTYRKKKWLLRPLLSYSRATLLEYARERKLRWREDASNLKEDYLRNRIRKRLMKPLLALHPKAVDCLSQAMGILGEEDAYFKEWIHREMPARMTRLKGGISISLGWLGSQPKALRYRIYRECLREGGLGLAGIEKKHLDALEEMILGRKTSMKITFPRGFGAYLLGKQFIFRKMGKTPPRQKRGFFY